MKSKFYYYIYDCKTSKFIRTIVTDTLVDLDHFLSFELIPGDNGKDLYHVDQVSHLLNPEGYEQKIKLFVTKIN